MKTFIRSLMRDENGADLIEYALLCALVSLGALNSMKTLSNGISNAFSSVGSRLASSV